MIFQTKSGSIYEVDHEKRLFRRKSKEQGDFKTFDYGFVSFVYTNPIVVGQSAAIFYGKDHVVRTSKVIRVLPDYEG